MKYGTRDSGFGAEHRHLAGRGPLKAGAPGTRFRPPESPFARRRCLVVGLGKTGASALRYLRSVGAQVRATDRESARAAVAGDVWRAPDEATNALAETDLVVVSPGVPRDSEPIVAARERGIETIGDIELFARAISSRAPSPESRVPVIGVTGTNGKSTVTSLVAAMAADGGRRAAAGANLGTPALDLLTAEADLYVLELSSFQLELTESLAPRVAVVLNVSADHLDRYASLADYAAAKARIYARAGTAVANRDDEQVMAMVRERADAVTFGLSAPASGHYGLRERGGRTWLCRGEDDLLAADEVPLAGRHNLANVLAAWALGAAVGLGDRDMARAVRGFRALPHRLASLGIRSGVNWLDDSKATNVAAACAALAGLAGPLVVIAGGLGKGQDFAPFADILATRARAVVLIGTAASEIERCLGGRLPVAHAHSMSDAVGIAAALARSGDCVVLAPACASLDMFHDYGERGEAFARAVEALDGD